MDMHTATRSDRLDAQLLEEGSAALHFGNATTRQPGAKDALDVIVIGGGQAGLSVGYHLARAGLRFTILDANPRIGDAWRNRWDSLRLFTSARLDGLDGMPFPAHRAHFPTKDEMADYLEAYAARFRLPVRNGVRVRRLFRRGEHYVAQADGIELEAPNVVVAMSGYQRGKAPSFAQALSPDIVQLHAVDYRNPGQLKPGPVLLVGAGNSGADIGLETARAGHETWIAGPGTGHLPFDTDSFLGARVLQPLLLRFVFHRLLTIRTPLGRKARPAILSKGAPLIRLKPKDLEGAGVKRMPRVVGARDGLVVLEDGRALRPANVIWCNGFDPGFDWIDLPVLGEDGKPRHTGGQADDQPGLYFVGLTFLYAMSSSMVHGVGRDAARIAAAIRARVRQAARAVIAA